MYWIRVIIGVAYTIAVGALASVLIYPLIVQYFDTNITVHGQGGMIVFIVLCLILMGLGIWFTVRSAKRAIQWEKYKKTHKD